MNEIKTIVLMGKDSSFLPDECDVVNAYIKEKEKEGFKVISNLVCDVAESRKINIANCFQHIMLQKQIEPIVSESISVS